MKPDDSPRYSVSRSELYAKAIVEYLKRRQSNAITLLQQIWIRG